jgi:hypothetical protein
MIKNIFISYELNTSGQDSEAVIEEIKSLGEWAKAQESHWYLKTTLTANQVLDCIWRKMNLDDSLIVIDTTNNAVVWKGLSNEVANYIHKKWN